MCNRNKKTAKTKKQKKQKQNKHRLWPETVFIKKDLHDILPRLVRLQLKIKVLQYYTV